MIIVKAYTVPALVTSLALLAASFATFLAGYFTDRPFSVTEIFVLYVSILFLGLVWTEFA